MYYRCDTIGHAFKVYDHIILRPKTNTTQKNTNTKSIRNKKLKKYLKLKICHNNKLRINCVVN